MCRSDASCWVMPASKRSTASLAGKIESVTVMLPGWSPFFSGAVTSRPEKRDDSDYSGHDRGAHGRGCENGKPSRLLLEDHRQTLLPSRRIPAHVLQRLRGDPRGLAQERNRLLKPVQRRRHPVVGLPRKIELSPDRHHGFSLSVGQSATLG